MTGAPKDNYKHMRTAYGPLVIQIQSSNVTYMAMMPKSRSPVLTSQLQSHLSSCLPDIFTCIFFFFFWLRWVFFAAHGLSLVVVCGLLIVVASLVAEHGL